jgi:hypothetical protein
MILQRQHYTELPWWKWAHLRGILAWTRISGGFARAVGIDRLLLKSTTTVRMQHCRMPPQLQTQIIESEMHEASEICPTKAIIRDKKNNWNINLCRCISCGLCYLKAPQSLAPSVERAIIMVSDQH